MEDTSQLSDTNNLQDSQGGDIYSDIESLLSEVRSMKPMHPFVYLVLMFSIFLMGCGLAIAQAVTHDPDKTLTVFSCVFLVVSMFGVFIIAVHYNKPWITLVSMLCIFIMLVLLIFTALISNYQ